MTATADGRTVRCRTCGDDVPVGLCDAVDVSREDEYYPQMEYYCRGCSL